MYNETLWSWPPTPVIYIECRVLLTSFQFFVFSCNELTFEFPFESAAILSLTGVNSIIANQWNCKLRDNREKFTKILEGNLDCTMDLNNLWLYHIHDCTIFFYDKIVLSMIVLYSCWLFGENIWWNHYNSCLTGEQLICWVFFVENTHGTLLNEP